MTKFMAHAKKQRPALPVIKNIIIFFFSLIFLSLSAYAEGDDSRDLDPSINGNLSIARCVAKGNLDFITFLKASIFDDGLEGIIEPFKDFISRNQCQANDISGLIHQKDNLRNRIRDAFLTCHTEKLPQLRLAYAKTIAEIYYVRHLVNANVGVSLPYNVIRIETSQKYFYPSTKLYAEMKSRYVADNKIKEKDFDIFYNSLVGKYNDRKNSYIICENSSWAELSEKWKEFINSNLGTKDALAAAKKDMGGQAEKIGEEFDKMGESLNTITDQGLTEYLKSFVQVNLNNQEAKLGFEEILDFTKKNTPFVGDSSTIQPLTQSSVLGTLQSTDTQYAIEEMRNKMASDFSVLYKDVSDQTVMMFVEEISNLNDAIKASLPTLNKVLNCAKAINSKQCPYSE